MSAYKPLPKALDTNSRKTRKSTRSAVFIYNAAIVKKARSEARRARKLEKDS